MREWCGCGAAIRARRKDVLDWRDRHRHGEDEPAVQVPPTGAASTLGFSYQPIGFRPNAT